MPSNPSSPHCSSEVNGGCAITGSATLIFRMIRNGARKNSSSQRYGNDRALAASAAHGRRCRSLAAHERSRIVLPTSQDRNTSSSHSTVSFAERRRFCALTWSDRAALQRARGRATGRRNRPGRGRCPSGRCGRSPVRRLPADRDLLRPHRDARAALPGLGGVVGRDREIGVERVASAASAGRSTAPVTRPSIRLMLPTKPAT